MACPEATQGRQRSTVRASNNVGGLDTTTRREVEPADLWPKEGPAEQPPHGPDYGRGAPDSSRGAGRSARLQARGRLRGRGRLRDRRGLGIAVRLDLDLRLFGELPRAFGVAPRRGCLMNEEVEDGLHRGDLFAGQASASPLCGARE